MPAASRRDGLRWWVARHRRPLAAVGTAVAVWAGLSAVRVRQAPTTGVLVAARDLPPGTTLAAGDVRTVGLPPAAVPPSALRPGTLVVGRAVAVAVAAGVPLTPASLSVGRLLPAGTEATPLRLADPGETALIAVGDRVDVLAAPADSGDPGGSADSGGPGGSGGSPETPATPAPAGSAPAGSVVAADVPVLAVPTPDTAAGDQGGLVVVAATPAQAGLLARAAADERLSVAVRKS